MAGKDYFWGGFGEGIGTGIEWRSKIYDLQMKNKAREELEAERVKAEEGFREMAKLFEQIDHSTPLSNEQTYRFSASFHAFPEEVQSRFSGAYKAIMDGNYNESKQQIEYVNSMMETILGMSGDILKYGNLDSFFDLIESSVTAPEALRYIDASKEMIKNLAPIQEQAAEAQKLEASQLAEQDFYNKQFEEEAKHLRAKDLEEHKQELQRLGKEHQAIIDIQTSGAKKAAEVNALLPYTPEVYTSVAELKRVHGEDASFKFVPSARGGQGGYVVESGESAVEGGDSELEALRKQLLGDDKEDEGGGFWKEVTKFLFTRPDKYFSDLYKRFSNANGAEKEQLKETLSDARSTAELIREEAYKRFDKMTEEQVAALAMGGDELAMQYGYEKWGAD